MITSWLILAILVAGAVGLLAFRPRGGMGFAWLLGLAILYVGQRLLAPSTEGTLFTVVGLLVTLAVLGMRYRAMQAAEGVVRDAWRDSLIWQTVATSGLLFWALSLPATTAALGFQDDALARWQAVFQTIWPIVLVSTGLPALLLDQMIAAHPVLMPEGGRARAVLSGLTLGLALALVFPVNYLADAHDLDADFSYFRVTQPGTSTQTLLRSQQDPVEALLFFPPGNDVLRRVEPYFRDLEGASEGRLSVRAVDQASDPVLAKELGVRDNGYVVFRQGDTSQKFKLDTELKRARSGLRKFDGTVLEHLLRLVSEKRVAYLLTGHGEATPRGASPFDKLGILKKILLSENYDVKDFGLEQGSADDIPEDAALVIVAGPERPLLQPELDALIRYTERGGALLIYADPGRDRMAGLLGHLGVEVGEHPLVHATRYIKLTGGITDRANLYSQRFGSHPAVATLSKLATRAVVAVLGTTEVRELEGGASIDGNVRYSPLIRSHEDTWTDTNGNYQRDSDEPTRVHVVATAIEGPESQPFRAIVAGDVQMASDVLIERVQGNAQFLIDSVRWLVGEDRVRGDIQNEEDVRIEHTRESDVAWFYGTIFGVPLLVLAAGAFIRRRSSRGGRQA